jgi:hypothetical protein
MDERENRHGLSSDDPVETGSLDDDADAADDEQPDLDVEGAESIARDEP